MSIMFLGNTVKYKVIEQRKMHGLAKWEHNFLKSNGKSEFFRSIGHTI